MTLMKKKLNKKGFTLAELLIVVAIIAVLAAIAIPVFNSQLEKARESADIANIRSRYAECVAEALTATTAGTRGNVTVAIDAGTGVATCTSTYTMTQKTAGFAAGDTTTVTIGGVTLDNDAFGNGTATITVKSDGTAPTISITTTP